MHFKSQDFNFKDLEFYLPNSFKGMSKDYMLHSIFNETIQRTWKPRVGDVIVGPTGNIFVIAGYHTLVPELGGTAYFFAPVFCSRDGSNVISDTICSVLNESGLKYSYTDIGIKAAEDTYYDSWKNYRYVPYPHELENYKNED